MLYYNLIANHMIDCLSNQRYDYVACWRNNGKLCFCNLCYSGY